MAPPLFADLGKPVSSLLDDDYSLKRLLKIKHTTPHGVAVTAEQELKKGGLASKVSIKYMHKPWHLSVDKLTVKPDAGMALESSLVNVAPGLKALLNVDPFSKKGDWGVEYSGPHYMLKSVVDTELTGLQTALTYRLDALSMDVGGATSYKFAGEKGAGDITDYAAGFAYKHGPFFASVTTAEKLGKYNLSMLYTYSKTVSIAGLASVAADKNGAPPSMTAGIKYACNPKTTLRAKVDSEGVVSAVASQLCVDKLVVAISGAVDAKSMQPKLGITCTLG